MNQLKPLSQIPETPQDRINEIASILLDGLIRYRQSPSNKMDFPLAFTAHQSVHGQHNHQRTTS